MKKLTRLFFAALALVLALTLFGCAAAPEERSGGVGALAGFLVWNHHPAKVFMGDTGSLFLGGMV